MLQICLNYQNDLANALLAEALEGLTQYQTSVHSPPSSLLLMQVNDSPVYIQQCMEVCGSARSQHSIPHPTPGLLFFILFRNLFSFPFHIHIRPFMNKHTHTHNKHLLSPTGSLCFIYVVIGHEGIWLKKIHQMLQDLQILSS